MAERLRVMISCGEPSGDLYAGALATELLRLEPDAAITGFGGERPAAAGASLVGDFSGLSVTGLTRGAARRFRAPTRPIARWSSDAAAQRPDVFVPIDFPDFNFLLARAMRKRGVPVVYYISPQLWAWRRGRMKTMQRDRRSRAGDLSVRGADLREAGVPVAVGRPSAARR